MPRNLLSVQAFESSGLLPPGEYSATCAELRESLLVRGPGVGTDWDAAWRLWLVDNVEILARQLWSVGIQDVFLDGSFVEDKSHPNDIDGYFVCDLQELASGRLQDALNRLDPHSVWTWNPNARRACRGYPKMQLPMWHQYRVSSIHITAKDRAYEMILATSLNFLLFFARTEPLDSPRASSTYAKKGVHYDSHGI